jgi:hypothetical protein
MEYAVTKNYSCHPKIYEKFRDNILYRGVIRKISVFCPTGIDYTENVGIINGWAAKVLRGDINKSVWVHQLKRTSLRSSVKQSFTKIADICPEARK